MSRKKVLDTTTNNRVYMITFKKSIHTYCYICQKRSGSYYSSCFPGAKYGHHGNKKPINGQDYRKFRTWKHTRKYQWKNA